MQGFATKSLQSTDVSEEQMLRSLCPAELAEWTAAEPMLEQTPVKHSGAASGFQEGCFSTQRWPVEPVSLQKRHGSVIRDSALSRRCGFPSSSCRCSPGHKVSPLPHAPPVPSDPKHRLPSHCALLWPVCWGRQGWGKR